MKLTAEFDRKKLEASLKKASSNFGDSTKQAVARWGVQSARQLAIVTQAFGQSGTRKIQINAIWASWIKCIEIVDPSYFAAIKSGKIRRRQNKAGQWEAIDMEMVTEDPAKIDAYVQSQRDRRGRIQSDRGRKIITTKKAMKAAIKKRLENVGMAKGGFLGAGKEIASKQTGTQRINIGKNFMGYAQKHGGLGHARLVGAAIDSEAVLDNNAKHTAQKNVLDPRNANKAIDDALKKTVKWYNKAAKVALDK